jgi:hypothetical protein
MDDILVMISVWTDKVGSRSETRVAFDRSEWDAMSEYERNLVCRDEMMEMIDWDYEVVE